MSDDVLSIIPSDPQWQPDSEAVDHVVALVEDLAPGVADGLPPKVRRSTMAARRSSSM